MLSHSTPSYIRPSLRPALALGASVLLIGHAAAAPVGSVGNRAFAPTQDDAQSTPPEASPEATEVPAAENVVTITRFDLQYIRESEAHPPVEELLATPITLGVVNGAYVPPRMGTDIVNRPLGELTSGGLTSFSLDAVQHVLETLVAELNRRSLISVFIAPDPVQIDEAGVDRRPSGETSLRLLIATGVVTEVRTLASGERIPDDVRVNNPKHDRIRRRSPIQPAGQTAEEQIDLVRRDVLDRYIFHLSRHPGRRVDVSLTAAEEPGTVALDYEITENRPLVIYAQVSNTGTEQTSKWRERFGFVHNQLTNNDDILSLDYVTTNFDESHAVVGSYEAPLGSNERLRWRIYASWSQYTASDVGFFDSDFEGESFGAGAEIAANVYQDRALFIDLVGGVRYDDLSVDNDDLLIEGDEQFFIPYIGARLERTTEWFSTLGSLTFEWQSDHVNSIDLEELEALGRIDPDDSWTIAQWNVSHSFFLEPVFDPESWLDPLGAVEQPTLAHELALSFRGQTTFGSRVIPQAQDVVGGLYSVRGYPESAVAGDTVLIGSAEYRYHVPRAFKVKPEPGELFGEPFRTAPQYIYGQPDWDLILKGFVDIGRVIQSDRASFEQNETLIGIGIGAELVFKRNFSVRLDWGFGLKDVESADIDAPTDRFHFVATILF